MFDLSAQKAVTLSCVDLNFNSASNTTIAIYYRSGTCVGHTLSQTGWTQLGSVTLQASTKGTPTAVPIPLNLSLSSGATTALYFAVTSGTTLVFTNGSGNVGDVVKSDNALTIKAGYGKSALFSTESSPALLNGTVHYSLLSPLPVELISFAGKFTAGANLLEWETASETQSSFFEVERSTDGQTFRPIGSLAAAGTSGQAHSYRYREAAPAGRCYYRLKQVDLDGSSTYSPVIVLEGTAAASFALYPNPVLDKVTLTSSSTMVTQLTLVLRDLRGQAIYQQQGAVTRNSPLPVELPALPAGLYILGATTATGDASYYRLLKVN